MLNLVGGTTYTIELNAQNELGVSAGSVSHTFTTKVSVPVAPALKFKSKTKDSISLSWLEQPNGGKPITSYKLTYYKYGETKYQEIKITDVDLRDIKIDNLTPNTDYVIYLTATNEYGVSASSNRINQKTTAPADESDEDGQIVSIVIVCLILSLALAIAIVVTLVVLKDKKDKERNDKLEAQQKKEEQDYDNVPTTARSNANDKPVNVDAVQIELSDKADEEDPKKEEKVNPVLIVDEGNQMEFENANQNENEVHKAESVLNRRDTLGKSKVVEQKQLSEASICAPSSSSE